MARASVPLNFNAFLEKAKLKDDGSNYTDWVRNLRIILITAQKNYVLDAPLGARPAAVAAADVLNVWQTKSDDYSIVQCAMLYGLESGLQRRFECHGAYEMFQELKLIFQANSRVERYDVSNKFYSCKMEENSMQVATPGKKPKSGPKPETECFYYQGTGHWKRNCPKYLADKKDGKVNKGIFDIYVIDVYPTNTRSSTWVFDTGLVARICNSK